MLKSYKDLIGYQKGYNLSLQIYKVTKELSSLSLSRDLGLLDSERYLKIYELHEEVSKILNGLIKSLLQKK